MGTFRRWCSAGGEILRRGYAIAFSQRIDQRAVCYAGGGLTRGNLPSRPPHLPLVRAGGGTYTGAMSEQEPVTILAFGSAAEVIGWASKRMDVAPGQSLAALIEALEQQSPGLGDVHRRMHYTLNQQYVSPSVTLKPGDEVAIVPPVAGGAEGRVSAARAPTARLVREPIDVAALLREVESTNVGAIATLSGVVQYETNDTGSPLKAVEYHAYEPMSLAEMHRLCVEATSRFPVHKALLVHRLGLLKVNDVSVAAVVSSAHRAEAIDACRTLIEGLATKVPIFCRQIWQGGATTWMNEA